MTSHILQVLGGLGLFLLGMVILTDGLRALAGGALRRMLARFTRSPLSGAVTGAAATALVQSSSVTTVTTVGFVGAGLLTFAQALGIIFGANIGTTITGWIVVIVGFKLRVGSIMLPLVLVGVLMRLFGRGRLRDTGWALAGFGLLFVGIEALQQGMTHFEGVVTPQDFPPDTWLGRFQLLLLGVAITLVTQSSSAGVATALAAIAAGTISFRQGAAMVIGMDVATTFKAALATVGGATATRRTGYAHVVYNLLTGIGAFFLLGPYASALDAWLPGGAEQDAQIALVGFHTFFNTLGVILVLPFARPFARFVIRLVPETGPPLTRGLDERLLRAPESAVEAVAITVRQITQELFSLLRSLLDGTGDPQLDSTRTRVAAAEEALEATQQFSEQIRELPEGSAAQRQHVASMHCLDHLNRLLHRCGQTARIRALRTDTRLRRLSRLMARVIASARLEGAELEQTAKSLNRLRGLLRRQRHSYRERTLQAASAQRIEARTALTRLDSIRWLHRVAYHLWRIAFHLQVEEKTDRPQNQPDVEQASKSRRSTSRRRPLRGSRSATDTS